MDRGADAQDQQDVGDVRSDDVAECHFCFAFEQRYHRRSQFRQRRAARHERDGDDRFADSERAGDRRSAFQKHLAAEDQSREPSCDHYPRQPQGYRFLCAFGVLRPVFQGSSGYGDIHSGCRTGYAALAFGCADHVPHQPDVEREHDDAVRAADPVRCPGAYQAVGSDRQQHERRGHAERDVAPDVFLSKHERPDQRADSQDYEDVENVRADDVADRHVAVARRGREYRDHQFGHRGADGDDRQADDEFRDAETLGYRRRAVRQEICAAEDQPQADE